MNIREELKQLRKRIDELEQQLEPEITEGQYWEDNSGTVCRVVNIEKDFNSDELPLIVDLQDLCSTKDMPLERCVYGFTLRERYILLSDDEVEQALIKEAKRRGFDEGVRVDSDNLGFTVGEFKIEGIEGWEYDTLRDEFKLHDWCIYKQGEWAEIIEDEWEVKNLGTTGMGKYVVTKGDRWINCSHGNPLERDEAYAIKHALNNLDND